MKKSILTLLLCLGAAAAVTGAPVAEETAQNIILRNNGAEYIFEKGKFYHLLESKYQGRTFWVNGFALTYNMPGDKWFWEHKPADIYKMAPRTHKIIKKGDVLTLSTRGDGKNMSLIRNYTLRGNSPELEVQVRLEVRNVNNIYWLNLFATKFPVTNEFWCLITREKQGKTVTRMEKIPHPFIDPVTKKYRTEGNYCRKSFTGLSFICSYDAKKDVGAILMQMPEKSRLSLRVGLPTEKSTHIFANVSPYFFSGTEKDSYLDAWYKVLPFTGSPENLNKTVVPKFVATMQKLYALPRSYDTGARLASSKEISLWSDLSSQKVYPSALPPAKRASGVTLFAAKGEGEGFILALRSSKAVKNITWQLPQFPGKVEAFPVQLTKRSGIIGITGEHPDVLLEEKSFDLAPDRTASLYVKVSVPENTKAGIYKGIVKLQSGSALLASVPVTLTVRDFSIEKRTLTAAHDFWWRPYGFDKPKYKEQFAKIEKMVIDARGGGRWLAGVKVTFDARGNLVKADYSAFDKSVELYTKVYKQPLMIARCFMLGYGHQLRKNLFGEAKDILTPLWKKKMLNFAKDFRQHLQKLNISDRVIMDLFDEPYEDSYAAINETVKLLRSVAPEWRFTYAGNFTPAVNGYVNFWNTGCTINMRDAQSIKAKGGAYSYYNPPVYRDNTELVKVRGYYNYLWNEKVAYVYQWVINCWSECGNRGWDEHRNASWVVPSPKGPLSTLRMENTREGIEDYEYCALLEKETARLLKKAPRLAAEGKQLLKKASKLNGRSPKDEEHVIISNDPMAYEMLHRQMGELLEKMSKVK